MKLTLEKVIGAIVVIVLGYMIYTHFLSRPTIIKIQKGKHNKPLTYNPGSDECKRRILECLKRYKEGENASPCIDLYDLCKDT